jgi:hypothetical protein
MAGGQWQITATVLDARGNELLSYAKVHLFGPEERKAFSPAEAAPAVVNLGGIKTSLAICYDVEFPRNGARGRSGRRRPAPGTHGAGPRLRIGAAGAAAGPRTGEPADSGPTPTTPGRRTAAPSWAEASLPAPTANCSLLPVPTRNCCMRRSAPRRPARHGMPCPICASGARMFTAPGRRAAAKRTAAPQSLFRLQGSCAGLGGGQLVDVLQRDPQFGPHLRLVQVRVQQFGHCVDLPPDAVAVQSQRLGRGIPVPVLA